MNEEQDELIPEEEAARYLGITPEHLRELATQGEIRLVGAPGADGPVPMYMKSEVFRLRQRLGSTPPETEADEWPELIDE